LFLYHFFLSGFFFDPEKIFLDPEKKINPSPDLGAGPCGGCLHWLDPVLDMEFQQAKS
jgi:hypothetical protein